MPQQKRWIDILGSDIEKCMVDYNNIVRVDGVCRTILHTCDTQNMAELVFAAWMHELYPVIEVPQPPQQPQPQRIRHLELAIAVPDVVPSVKPAHRGHGSPYDRGGADRYYGRSFEPHYYRGPVYQSPRIKIEEMTNAEFLEYKAGWDEQTERKDWGW